MNCANFNKLPLSSKFTPAARSRGIAVWCFACILLSLTRQFHVGASCWWQSAETAVLGVWEYIAQSQLLGNTLCSREGLWMYLEQEDQWLAEADSGLNSSLVVSAPQSALQEKGKPCFVAFVFLVSLLLRDWFQETNTPLLTTGSERCRLTHQCRAFLLHKYNRWK